MVPVHVVAGFLGAGKTTLLREQLALRAGTERCAVVVNDFGEASIDATLLDGGVGVTEIAGGCVCCTAPEGLVPALRAIVDELEVDRIFIEPTGLARPADLVDTLARSGLPLELRPVVVVVDPSRLASQAPLLLEQIDAAEILVANRVDLATDEALQAFRALADRHYPPLTAVAECERGQVSQELFSLRRQAAPATRFTLPAPPSTAGYAAASRTWDQVFDMGALKAWIRSCGAERFKGLFHTDIGCYRIELSGGVLEAVPSLYRGPSRADLIVLGSAEGLLDQLDPLVYVPTAHTGVALQHVGGQREVSRAELAALPGQVDVAEHVPGRAGEGVMLREVLALGDGSRFVVVASDGMTTAPVPVGEAGNAVLVHGLDGEALPEGKGGPFRLLVPPGEGSACANVKKVVRIQLAD